MSKTDKNENKEIPKLVVNHGYVGKHRECGACGALLNQDHYLSFDYCPCCGQKLDWGELS